MHFSKKLLFFVSLPLFVLVLSGCGKQAAPNQPGGQQPQSAPEKAQLQQQQQTPAGQAEAPLPPLPADKKAAIDQEISGIDQELKTVDTSSVTNDLSDSNLGI